MKQVPGSRFLLVRPECLSRVLCTDLTAEFERNGIGADRVYFVDNRAQMLNHLLYYDEMDVTLDTFPVTGGNTTVDALWMGAPVIARVGNSLNQRLCYALLHHIGLDELCAFSDEDYVRIAVALASDRDRLRDYRFNLRQRFLDSPLGRTDRFAENFQDVMEDLARKHGLV
jgi:protein O-GlcNAc transferase